MPEDAPKDDARDALLAAIKRQAEDVNSLHLGSRPAALLQLAEAYAYIVSPNNAH